MCEKILTSFTNFLVPLLPPKALLNLIPLAILQSFSSTFVTKGTFKSYSFDNFAPNCPKILIFDTIIHLEKEINDYRLPIFTMIFNR